jgi:hypothetical protein
MVALHVDKLTGVGTRCIVHHNYGVGTWSEVIKGELSEGKEYARFQVEPRLQVRLRCLNGQIIAEVHSQVTGTVGVVEASPAPWTYQRG